MPWVNGKISSVACRARPTPCDAYVSGTDENGNPAGLYLVTNDQRMIDVLLNALVDQLPVDLFYGEQVEYRDEFVSTPVTLVGNLLQSIKLRI